MIGSLKSEKSGPYNQRNRVPIDPYRVPNIFLKKTLAISMFLASFNVFFVWLCMF